MPLYNHAEPLHDCTEPLYNHAEPLRERAEPLYNHAEPLYDREEPLYENPKAWDFRGNSVWGKEPLLSPFDSKRS